MAKLLRKMYAAEAEDLSGCRPNMVLGCRPRFDYLCVVNKSTPVKMSVHLSVELSITERCGLVDDVVFQVYPLTCSRLAAGSHPLDRFIGHTFTYYDKKDPIFIYCFNAGDGLNVDQKSADKFFSRCRRYITTSPDIPTKIADHDTCEGCGDSKKDAKHIGKKCQNPQCKWLAVYASYDKAMAEDRIYSFGYIEINSICTLLFGIYHGQWVFSFAYTADDNNVYDLKYTYPYGLAIFESVVNNLIDTVTF